MEEENLNQGSEDNEMPQTEFADLIRDAKTPWGLLAVFLASYALLMFLPYYVLTLPLALGAWLLYWSVENPGEASRIVRLVIFSAFICTIVGVISFLQTDKAQLESSFPFLVGLGITFAACSGFMVFHSRKDAGK